MFFQVLSNPLLLSDEERFVFPILALLQLHYHDQPWIETYNNLHRQKTTDFFHRIDTELEQGHLFRNLSLTQDYKSQKDSAKDPILPFEKRNNNSYK